MNRYRGRHVTGPGSEVRGGGGLKQRRLFTDRVEAVTGCDCAWLNDAVVL